MKLISTTSLACDLSGSSKDEQFQSLHGFGQKNIGPPGKRETLSHGVDETEFLSTFYCWSPDLTDLGKERMSRPNS